jgi:hypothetical protein
MRKSIIICLVAVFAALHTTLYFLPYALWRNWAVLLGPIEGIILGPYVGFFAALLGSSISRIVAFDPFWMFGIIAEPVSVLIVGLLSRRVWKPALLTCAMMLLAYSAHPFGRSLPLWTILDVLAALILIYPAARLSNRLFSPTLKGKSTAVLLISFVGIATDSLVRVFLLIPCGLSGLFFTSFEQVSAIFTGGAVASYIEDSLVVAVSLLVGVVLIVRLSKQGLQLEPANKKGEKNAGEPDLLAEKTEKLLNNVKP